MNTFKNAQYTITTSLNERAIYIKVANMVSYVCYEGNFDTASFKLPFEIEGVFELVNKCFGNNTETPDKDLEKGYRVKMELDNVILKLVFHCVVGGFLNVNFDLRLREKVMSNDAQLTINFQRVEQKQQQAFEQIMKRMVEMERRLEALGNAEICFENPSNVVNKTYPIDSKILTITDGNTINANSFKKVKRFYQLEELALINCHNWGHSAETNISNATVQKLTINNGPAFTNIKFIKNFPSLVELTMTGFAVDASIVTTMRSIKHNIKQLTFQSCPGINTTEMQTYCTQNGIKLNLS